VEVAIEVFWDRSKWGFWDGPDPRARCRVTGFPTSSPRHQITSGVGPLVPCITPDRALAFWFGYSHRFSAFPQRSNLTSYL
jgi:hypothetical protein